MKPLPADTAEAIAALDAAQAEYRAFERELADGQPLKLTDAATYNALNAAYARLVKPALERWSATLGPATGNATGGPRCEECGKPLGPSTPTSVRYCSSSCRGKAFRARGGRR